MWAKAPEGEAADSSALREPHSFLLALKSMEKAVSHSLQNGTSGDRVSSADQFAFLFVFGPVDFAAGKAPIENGKRGVPSCA
jgi:hypothetical protein